MSDRYDHLDDSEREWLRTSRRTAARRSWLLIAVLALVALFLAWLTIDGLPRLNRQATTTTTTTPDQRAIADGQRALADWAEFAVTNDLNTVKDTFWANGPQYKQLAKEAKARKPLGPPPYTMTLSGVQVLKPREDQRVLRGRVQVTRPGEQRQTFNWDLWMQLDPAAGGRWRLWTVRETAAT